MMNIKYLFVVKECNVTCHCNMRNIKIYVSYTFITASGMPIAKKFVRWINSEVIQSIRKYGQYKLKQRYEFSEESSR